MDADERLAALQKTYADVILNTSKEAGARVMAAEQKARRFEDELNATKAQAIQMFLRLKQMMDSKVGKAEMTYMSQQRKIKDLKAQLRGAENTINLAGANSLSQQRKIEELEAQLEEAEDIVTELREELAKVRAELERVRESKLQNRGEHDNTTQDQDEASLSNKLSSCEAFNFPPKLQLGSCVTSNMKSSDLHQRNDSCVENSHTMKPNLSSTLQENELNTSEPMVLASESCVESFTALDTKSSGPYPKNEVYKCSTTNNILTGDSNVCKPFPSTILSSNDLQPYRNPRIQRIRAFEEKLMAGELFPDPTADLYFEERGNEDEECEKISKTPTRYRGQGRKSSQQKTRKRTTYKKKKTLSLRHLSDQAPEMDQTSDIIVNNASSGGDPSNMGTRLLEDVTYKGISSECNEGPQSEAKVVKGDSVDNTTGNEKAPSDKFWMDNVEKVEMPVVNSLTITSSTRDGVPNQTLSGRVIKFTFQRKRKKESLSSCEGSASLEQGVLKRNAEKKQNGPLEMENCSSITGPPRDCWHLTQFAYQLPSLSER